MTFRSRLIAIAAVNVIALLVLVTASSLLARETERQIDSIQQRYVPRIGVHARLVAELERVSRSLQDAASAGDEDLLDAARGQEEALLAEIAAAVDVIPRDVATRVRDAITRYYEDAAKVSARLIAGDGGDDLPVATAAMQREQVAASEMLDQATRVDEHELAAAFTSALDAEQAGARIRLIVSLICLFATVGLSVWIGRGLFRSLSVLGEGFDRFARGDLAARIPDTAANELGDVARQANQMAARLESLDWQSSGHAGLVEHLRGELEPEEAATRAVAFLARHLGVPVGAIYYDDGAGQLAALGHYGVEPGDARFRRGEGVVGEAATRTEITVIDLAGDGDATIRSGLVELHPRALALVPLLRLGNVTGILELVLLRPWTDDDAQLILSVRESMTIAIEVARARAATRKLLAKTQRQATELGEARARLEQKADELLRISAYKSQFLAGMSHELRTPLNAIIGFSELLADGLIAPEAPEHKEFLGHILASGRHLLQLINDVLDLSKVEAGKLEFHPDAISLTKVVREVLGILKTAAAARRVEIVQRLDPAVDELVLDPARLKQILYNYLSNAIKFTPIGGRVELRANEEDAAHVRIEVEDTGDGIAPEHLGQLFADFQQVGAKKSGGTGLGLALTKRLVVAQGGSVGARSVVGRGSVFHAILPKALARHTQTIAAVEPPLFDDSAPTVLVVEDDPQDRAELVVALRGAGYAVEVAASGRDALARVHERVFDAITLDLLLPDMSGLDVLRELRAEGKNRAVPVIVITVVAEHGAVAGFAVSDVLPKPVAADVLHQTLLRVGVSPRSARDVLVVDDDSAALQLMSTTLQQLGYSPRCEADAARALGSLDDWYPAAIVLDLVMPGMSGFEFLDQLRATEHGRDVPVIIWTSKELSADEHGFLRSAADAVVSKGRGGAAGVVAELAVRLRSTQAPR